MADLSFRIEPRILIGLDVMGRVGRIVSEQGGRALIVTEPVLYETKVVDRLLTILGESQVESLVFDEIPAQATAEVAESAARLAKGARCTMVIAVGGLKTIAVGRLAALLATDDAYLFDVLDGDRPAAQSLPVVVIPTAGRDSFIFTNHLAIVDPRDRSVRMVSSPESHLVAAVLDPSISESMTRSVAATTVLDGFCGCVEAYCSSRANFFSDALLERAMATYFRIMDALIHDDRSFDVAGETVQAGFLASLGSAESSPGVGTALSYAINARFPVAKAWVSALLTPYVMELFLPARVERLAKIADLAGETGEGMSVAASASSAVDGIRKRMGLLKVPARLKNLGLQLDRLAPTAENARNLDFVAYAPRPLSIDDVYDLLKQAY